MFKYLITAAITIVIATPVVAGITPFPPAFRTQMVSTNGTELYVRVAGQGPAVVLLHGFADSGDMWAPLAGIGDWENIIRSPLLWHFNFRGPDEERLVQGRERIYLDRFWNELSADPKKIDEQTREHYASLYARPHAIHDAMEQFGAFDQDAIDNKALLAKGGKLRMPVLAIGGEKSSGSGMVDIMNFVATNVSGGIVPNSGHWIMEENPQATIKLAADFLAK